MQLQLMQQKQPQKEQLPQQQQMVQIVYTSQQQQHQTQRATAGTQIYQLVSPGATVGGSSRLPAQQQQVRILNSSGQTGLMLQQRAVVLSATPQPQQQQVRIIRAPPVRLSTAVVGHLQPAVSSSSAGGTAVGSVNKSRSMASGQDNKPLLTHSWPQQQPPVISLQAPSVHRQLQLPAVSSVQNASSLLTATGTRPVKVGGMPSSDIAARGMTAASSRPGMMTAGSMRPAVMTSSGVSTSRVVTVGSVMPTPNQLVPRLVLYEVTSNVCFLIPKTISHVRCSSETQKIIVTIFTWIFNYAGRFIVPYR
jgi:hypothetical protein